MNLSPQPYGRDMPKFSNGRNFQDQDPRAKDERNRRISTGSEAFDSLLSGGLRSSSVTDVFGAAGTGKTQFAFQTALMDSSKAVKQNQVSDNPLVAFVDCKGSFRPERITEMLRSRGLEESEEKILQTIHSIRVRSRLEQIKSCDRLLNDERFSSCRLLVVDDVSENFVSDSGNAENEIIERQSALAVYARQLAFIANSRKISVLITNSVRFRGEEKEGETTGGIFSEFSLFRIRFRKTGRERNAYVEQPYLKNNCIDFVIGAQGIP